MFFIIIVIYSIISDLTREYTFIPLITELFELDFEPSVQNFVLDYAVNNALAFLVLVKKFLEVFT
jgi:hypothetical protein